MRTERVAARPPPSRSLVQVADRWHLLRNLTDALERLLDGKSALLREAVRMLAPPTAVPVEAVPSPVSAAHRCPNRQRDASAHRRARRLERYRAVIALHERSVATRTIARQVGLSRQTVARWIRAGAFPERKPPAPVASKLDHYRPYLERRVREGCQNATPLHRELRRDGYRGGVTIVREAVRRLTTEHPLAPPVRLRRPSVRRTAWLLLPGREGHPRRAATYINALTRMSPELEAARRIGRDFARILTEHDAGAWDGWLAEAEVSPLRSFAKRLLHDEAAVRAAAELAWSTSPVEGHINRLKLVKRTMYGRAGFELLRARVLHAA